MWSNSVSRYSRYYDPPIHSIHSPIHSLIQYDGTATDDHRRFCRYLFLKELTLLYCQIKSLEMFSNGSTNGLSWILATPATSSKANVIFIFTAATSHGNIEVPLAQDTSSGFRLSLARQDSFLVPHYTCYF